VSTYVFSSEETRGKRGPDSGSVLVLIVQRSKFDLEALAVEGVVLRLLGNGSDQVVALGDLCGFLNLDCGPFGGTPVVGLKGVSVVGQY
jgi:hypothetical protein